MLYISRLVGPQGQRLAPDQVQQLLPADQRHLSGQAQGPVHAGRGAPGMDEQPALRLAPCDQCAEGLHLPSIDGPHVPLGLHQVAAALLDEFAVQPAVAAVAGIANDRDALPLQRTQHQFLEHVRVDLAHIPQGLRQHPLAGKPVQLLQHAFGLAGLACMAAVFPVLPVPSTP
jgi:hypothetical protein